MFKLQINFTFILNAVIIAIVIIIIFAVIIISS
jgi:hypothetical protein